MTRKRPLELPRSRPRVIRACIIVHRPMKSALAFNFNRIGNHAGELTLLPLNQTWTNLPRLLYLECHHSCC